MKVYISGGITIDPYGWIDKFNNAEKKLYEKFGKDTVVFNPTLTKNYDGKITYDEFLKIDFTFIDICDSILMLPDWTESKGAKLEYEYALSKNKNIMYYKELFMEEKEMVTLNGQTLTQEQFKEEKKKLEEKHISIVEVEKNVYKTRLQD